MSFKLPCSYKLITTLIILLAAASICHAESTSQFWGDLQPGPYDVGFQAVEKWDHSRTFRDRLDYDGNLRPGETARPMQICIWYPAVKKADDLSMVYGEYAFPVPEDGDFYNFLSAVQAREVGYIMPLFNMNPTIIQDLMNAEVGAIRDADPAEGTFPVIIYHPDIGGGISENAAMFEYLASHGFIVATSHAFGSKTVEVSPTPESIETLTRDRELAYGFVREFPSADMSRCGLLGYGFGGIPALIMQMRNSNVVATATLDPAFIVPDYADMTRGFPGFDPLEAHVSLMSIYNADFEQLDLSLWDSLKYATRYSLGLKNYTHNDFSQYVTASALITDTTGTGLVKAAYKYHSVCRQVLDFFGSQLENDAEATDRLMANAGDESVEFSFAEKEIPPPTQTQFMQMLQDGKIDRAIEIFEQLRAANPDYVLFQEANINALGYQLLQQNRIDEAQMIFKINTEAFPHHANVWDSYADGCLAGGDIETAITCYQKVLEVLPTDSTMNEQVRDYLRNNATQSLETLQN